MDKENRNERVQGVFFAFFSRLGCLNFIFEGFTGLGAAITLQTFIN